MEPLGIRINGGFPNQLKEHDLGLSRLPPPGPVPNPQPKDLPGPVQLLTQ